LIANIYFFSDRGCFYLFQFAICVMVPSERAFISTGGWAFLALNYLRSWLSWTVVGFGRRRKLHE